MNWIIVDMWLVGSTVVGIALLVLAHLTDSVRGVPAPDDPAMQQQIAFPSPSLNS
jgi:hypothetical protein